MKIQISPTKIFVLFSILFFAHSVKSQSSDSIYTLPAGTRIKARMDNEINSKVSSVNDTFTVTVSAPVVVREVEILPAGAILEGRIISVKSAKIGGKAGEFKVEFETLRLPNNKKQKIFADFVTFDKEVPSYTSKALPIAGGSAAGAIIGAIFSKTKGALIGAGAGLGIGTSLVLLQKGKEARIKSNEEITVVLKREVTLPPEDF